MSIFEKAFEKQGQEENSKPYTPQRNSHESGIIEDVVARADRENSTHSEGHATDHSSSRGQKIDLDLEQLQVAGIINPQANKANRIADEFRRVKRPLLMNAKGQGASLVDNANMIMVTSALAGEGKTFTSINLAMSIAMEMDKTVLLVDADVAKPDVTKRLGIEAEKGLIDVLLGEGVSLQDVLIRTNIPKLTLLPSGRRHVHATELLASDAMQKIGQELSTRYSDRIVLFDSPPLMVTNEARVLASLMGQIVLVVEETRTPQPVVKEALSMVESSEIVGVVLNKGQQHDSADYYAGYGYYGYGR